MGVSRSRATLLAAWMAGVRILAAAEPAERCEGFQDWRESPYVLPYAGGSTYRIDQANCSPEGNGHRGVGRYAYDFLMPIGTRVTVARAGIVLHVEESHADGEVAYEGKDNYVVVRHEDGTVGLYGHLTRDGSAVQVGDVVAQGAMLGSSGNTGNTNDVPHLHLSVHSCDPVTLGSAACPTLPVTFRNTTANPKGLKRGKTYTAR